MTVEWAPIEELFARLSGLSDHAKRVIEHRFGPELQKNVLERIVEYVRTGESKAEALEWLIGCNVMGVYPEDRHIDFGWGQVSDARVVRVTQLLLEAHNLS